MCGRTGGARERRDEAEDRGTATRYTRIRSVESWSRLSDIEREAQRGFARASTHTRSLGGAYRHICTLLERHTCAGFHLCDPLPPPPTANRCHYHLRPGGNGWGWNLEQDGEESRVQSGLERNGRCQRVVPPAVGRERGQGGRERHRGADGGGERDTDGSGKRPTDEGEREETSGERGEACCRRRGIV